MVDLRARTPCDGLLPLEIGDARVTEEALGVLTLIAPFRGREDVVSEALQQAHGLAFPRPNRTSGKAGARAIWFARGQALLAGPLPDPALARDAALCDQSDAWAAVRLEGAAAEDVLARLVPVDTRRAQFRRGHTMRTDLSHMVASLTRLGDGAIVILVFRSMAASLVSELKTAMEAVAARG